MQIQNNTIDPSTLKITDMRFADIDGAPKRCTLIKLYTNKGLVGYGEVRDASSKTYALMLKSRILGRKGHLSNASGASAAVELLNAGARHLLLGHLSSENNTPEMAFQTSKAALENEGARVGSDVTLHVASRFQPSVIYTLS